MKLTELAVRKLRAKPKRFEVLDGKGLYLRIAETGTKSWVYRYMQGGRARRYTIGQYPDIGLADARKIHAELRVAVKSGKDPAAAKTGEACTFSDLLEEFWKKALEKTKSGRQRRLQIEKDALPAWGHRLVADISRRDAVLLLDKVRERAPVTANRLQSDLVRMMAFAAERGIIEFSQLGGMRKGPEKPRTRFLTDEEIRLFWTRTDGTNLVDPLPRDRWMQRRSSPASRMWDRGTTAFGSFPTSRQTGTPKASSLPGWTAIGSAPARKKQARSQYGRTGPCEWPLRTALRRTPAGKMKSG